MPKTPASDLLIGAHTSAAGGAWNALIEGKKIGATTIQLFTANQKRWESPPLAQSAVDQWKKTLEETQIKKVMSHDSYLINLGAPDAENLTKSLLGFHAEIVRCKQLNIDFLNFHPGAALKDPVDKCLDRIVESLLSFKPLLTDGNLRLLIETTAGQGSTVGWNFKEIAYILGKTLPDLPIGVCIDTCHIFVAGYDLRTKEACRETFAAFDREIGLQHLYALHVNDSVKGLGSRVDRHAPLGQGMIGMECFKFIMNDLTLREIPKYLETPDGPILWEKEIALLRQLA